MVPKDHRNLSAPARQNTTYDSEQNVAGFDAGSCCRRNRRGAPARRPKTQGFDLRATFYGAVRSAIALETPVSFEIGTGFKRADGRTYDQHEQADRSDAKAPC